MTFDQVAIVVLLASMLIAFATERWRIEIIALAGLAAGFVLGIVPSQQMFQGFASPAVITVIEILLIVSVLTRSRVIDDLARGVVARVRTERALLAVLCAGGAFVSVFMNNIGALALFFPVALSVAQQLNLPPGRILMPLSFATLLGGMCSLTGTPANLVVNQWMVGESGRNFAYFELGTIGVPLVIAGIAWMSLFAPRAFSRFMPIELNAGADPDCQAQTFLAERTIAQTSRYAGMRLKHLEQEAGVEIHGVLRDGRHVFAHRDMIVLKAGDAILLECGEAVLEGLDGSGELEPAYAEPTLNAVIMPESLLVGSRVEDLDAMSGNEIGVSALASRRGRVEGRFSDLQFSVGDIVSLSGPVDAGRALARECGLLVLAPRTRAERSIPRRLAAILFATGVGLTAFGIAPVEIAFGGVVLALIATGLLDIRRALADLNWRIILLLGCMIPLGLAVDETGAARVLADFIAEGLPNNSAILVIAAVLAMGIAVTPFIDNVSTAVILSPIAAELAVRTGTPVGIMLMAVAIGASIDFLTPFGHHNNTIVMGAGNYRFSDFGRFGGPLTLLCFVIALAVLTVLA